MYVPAHPRSLPLTARLRALAHVLCSTISRVPVGHLACSAAEPPVCCCQGVREPQEGAQRRHKKLQDTISVCVRLFSRRATTTRVRHRARDLPKKIRTMKGAPTVLLYSLSGFLWAECGLDFWTAVWWCHVWNRWLDADVSAPPRRAEVSSTRQSSRANGRAIRLSSPYPLL